MFDWLRLIKSDVEVKELFQVPDLETGNMRSLLDPLNDIEEEMFRNFMKRLHAVFKFAKERDVRVMVDAEQTYLQPAISRLTMEMMQIYNKVWDHVFKL